MKKKVNKSLVLSIIFFFLFIIVVVAAEMHVFDRFTSVKVVVADETIEKDSIIQENQLTTMEIKKEFETDQMILNKSDVVGKTATQTILPSQYISETSLDQSILYPSSEHEFFPIPNEWLMEIQGTIRRYDLINISAVYAATGNDTNVNVSIGKINDSYVLEDVPVAYVKGNRNQEVTSATEGDNRLYGTQNPSNIQLSLTLEEFKKLESLYLEGYKLVISY